MHKEQTELEKVLARFQGYHEAFAGIDLEKNLASLKERAQEVAKGYDFLDYKETSDHTFAINVKLGLHVEGRIVVSNNIRAEMIEFALSTPSTGDAATIHTKRNDDNLLITTSQSSDNAYKIGEHIVNKSFIDYLLTVITSYLIEKIENDED